MNVNLILLPLLSPLFGAIFCMFFRKKIVVQKILVLVALIAMIIGAFCLLSTVNSHGVLALQGGGWQAPFGITLVADLFSSIMVAVTSIVCLAVFVYSLSSLDTERKQFGFYTIFQFLIFGITGAFLAGDIFNLYVWFEIILVSTFVLLALGGTKDQLEGAVKYVTINFIASSIFLAGIGIVYGVTGTLNMADLSEIIQGAKNTTIFNLAAVFFIVAFGIKAAMFPLFFWLPPSYHTPPIVVTAMISGLLTKVGAYSLIRFFTLIFRQDIPFTHTILMYLAVFSLVIGVVGAIVQKDLRKVMTYSIISQIGYIILGLAFFTPIAIAGAILFLIHNILVKTNLLLITGVIKEAGGSFDMTKVGGLYSAYPLVAALYIISGFALTGLPPLSGFWGKLLLIQGGLAIEEYTMVFVTLAASVMSLIYMTNVWNEAFWKNHPGKKLKFLSQPEFFKTHYLKLIPVVFITMLILVIGLYPAPFYEVSMKAAEQLHNPESYVNAVLKGK